ncbi:MAG TPA: CpsD/CapB family tyrosine-protein kinase [Terriglobales bacterium]|jgi:capsular exopolysaccharide synthesis family protein|nr:CpsD/CapB family tyrosine-protein kinase [Terriglobales bacterium]
MSRIHEALKKAEDERAASLQTSYVEVNPEVLPHSPIPQSPLDSRSPIPQNAPGQFNASQGQDVLLTRTVESKWAPEPGTMLFFNEDEQAFGTEEFRTLRSRLYQIRERQPLRKLLVTSALPQEGKSFVSSNLAQAMVRQHGRKALLIDADLRASQLHRSLGTNATPGLAEYLLGENDEFAIMQRGPMENLFFIPAGRMVSNPAELLANGRLNSLLNRLESFFDWIIVDAPPAVPISDAALLAKCCDGVLMVVRSNETPFDVARKARMEFKNTALVGIVLNGVDGGTSYSKYYYAAYGNEARAGAKK